MKTFFFSLGLISIISVTALSISFFIPFSYNAMMLTNSAIAAVIFAQITISLYFGYKIKEHDEQALKYTKAAFETRIKLKELKASSPIDLEKGFFVGLYNMFFKR